MIKIKKLGIIKQLLLLLASISCMFGAIDINTATADELTDLNGIGKVKAQKIVEYREQIACFESIDALAKIDGIGVNIVSQNQEEIVLGQCENAEAKSEPSVVGASFAKVLFDPVNIAFVMIIFVLVVIDVKTGRDLKSQIVSVGVLGTFVGIFIGLQGFDPSDIINSVNDILVGLKTAFFTSIVGMGAATTLSIIEKLREQSEVK